MFSGLVYLHGGGSVHYNGRFLPDLILLTLLYATINTIWEPDSTPLRDFVLLQPMFSPKRFDIFSPRLGGYSELIGLDGFRFFLNHDDKRPVAIHREMLDKVFSCCAFIALSKG